TTVVGNAELHVRRQALPSLIELFFDVENDLAGVRAVTDDNDAADGFALAIELGDAAAHVGAEFDIGNLAKENGHAFVAHADCHFPQVVQLLDITLDAQNEFLLGQLDGPPSYFAVALFDCRGDFRNGEVKGAEFGRVHGDLILFDEAADGSDFGDAFDRGE